jgi:hypothetical protein
LDDRWATDNEKYVFRAGIYSSDEINKILTDSTRRHLQIRLIGVKLAEINFHAFGEKIRWLEIEACDVENPQTIRDMFLQTPNLITFRCHVANEVVQAGDDQTSFFYNFMLDLQDSLCVMNALEEFQWQGDVISFPANFSFHALYNIFPRLRRLHLPRINLNVMVSQSNEDVKTDLKEISQVYVNTLQGIAPPVQKCLLSLPM